MGNRNSLPFFLRSIPVAFLAVCGSFAFSSLGHTEQISVIKENFEEATLGSRLSASAGTDQNPEVMTGMHPEEGKFFAFIGDEAEIVEGWDGKALQFQDVVRDANLRLVYGTLAMDPLTSGVLEVSLEFRLDGAEGAPYEEGSPLQVKLNAGNENLITTVVYRDNARIYSTNRSDPPAHEGMISGESAMMPGEVYQLQLVLSLDKFHYDIEVKEKTSGNVIWQEKDLPFVVSDQLKSQGLGENLLDIQAGTPDFSQDREPPSTVTIDNISVQYKE